MEIVLFNIEGRPIAYCEDGENIYLYDGTPAAYFYQDSVYSFSGVHLGRFADGWIRDNSGYCVFFTDNAVGGPVKPVRYVRPVKYVKKVRPVKNVKYIKPVKSVNITGWSDLSSEEFFE